MTHIDPKTYRKQNNVKVRPNSHQNVSHNHGGENIATALGIYSNGRYEWTTFAPGVRNDTSLLGNFQKSKNNGMTFTFRPKVRIKRLLYNGFNNLRTVAVANTNINPATSIGRLALSPDQTKIAVRGVIGTRNFIRLYDTNLDFIKDIDIGVANITAVFWVSNTEVMLSFGSNILFFNINTGLQVGPFVAVGSATIDIQEDANFWYLYTGQLRRIAKATRLIDATALFPPSGDPVAMDKHFNRLWFRGLNSFSSFNLAGAWVAGSFSVSQTINNNSQNLFFVSSPTRMFLISQGGFSLIHTINPTTGLLTGEKTDIMPSTSNAFFHDNKICIVAQTAHRFYDANTMEYLYTSIPTTPGLRNTDSVANLSRAPIILGRYMYGDNGTTLYKVDLQGSVTINGNNTNRMALDINADEIVCTYTGLIPTDMFPNIQLVYSF